MHSILALTQPLESVGNFRTISCFCGSYYVIPGDIRNTRVQSTRGIKLEPVLYDYGKICAVDVDKEEPEHLEAIGLRRKAIDSPADLEASKRPCVPCRVVLSHIPAQ